MGAGEDVDVGAWNENDGMEGGGALNEDGKAGCPKGDGCPKDGVCRISQSQNKASCASGRGTSIHLNFSLALTLQPPRSREHRVSGVLSYYNQIHMSKQDVELENREAHGRRATSSGFELNVGASYQWNNLRVSAHTLNTCSRD